MSNQPPQDPQGGQPGGYPNGPQGNQPGGYQNAPQEQGGGYGNAPQGGQPGGYQNAPQEQGGGYSSAPQMQGGGLNPQAPAGRPKSIDMAVKLMYVGAGLSLLSIIASFIGRGAIEDQVRESNATAGTNVDIDAAVTAALIFGVVVALISVGLWLLMAKFNGDGKSWARIVATVLGAISILFTLLSFTQATAPLNLVLNIISVLLAAAILFFLWKPESTAFYQARSAPRR